MKNVSKNLSDISKLTAKAQLSSFGLNPNQWKLIKNPGGIYKIQNIKSKSFVLGGSRETNQWKSIWLISV